MTFEPFNWGSKSGSEAMLQSNNIRRNARRGAAALSLVKSIRAVRFFRKGDA